MDIKILVDTSSDIYYDVAEKYGIGILSIRSVFGDETLRPGLDITPEQFVDKMVKTGIFPKTCQTPPLEMLDTFKKETDEHDAVIYFCMSSNGSGQYNTCQMLREELLEYNPNAKLYIVDTMSYSILIGKTAIYATELVKQGLTPEEIIEKATDYLHHTRCMLVVDNLNYLVKGGRIKKSVATVGNILNIKPVLDVYDGVMDISEKLRGSKKIMGKLIAKLENDGICDLDNPDFCVIHTGEPNGKALEEALKEHFGEQTVTHYQWFGSIIATHVGPGAYAVIYHTK